MKIQGRIYRPRLDKEAWCDGLEIPPREPKTYVKNGYPIPKIKRLEKKLSDEKAKNLILKTLVDTIEKQYGANLRKKQHTSY